MNLSGLRKVPDHVALLDDIALFNQDSMFPSENGKLFIQCTSAQCATCADVWPDSIYEKSGARLDEDGHFVVSTMKTATHPSLVSKPALSGSRKFRDNLQAASLDCSGWGEERDAGRARLDRVEGGDSRRTGPSRTTTKMYSWESVTSHLTVPVLLRSQRFVTLL
jgi:hypothetical protein